MSASRVAILLFAYTWLIIHVISAVSALPTQQTGQEQAQGFPKSSSDSPIVYPEVLPAVVYGEVVDVWCYCSRSVGIGRGEAHKRCAEICAAGGASLGILDDHDKLYIAAKTGGFKGANDLLMPFVAKRVKVKGWYAHRGGCEVLKIDSVTLAKEPPKSGQSNVRH